MEGQVAYLQDELFISLKRDSFHGNVNEILGVCIMRLIMVWSSPKGPGALFLQTRELSSEYIRSHSRRNFGSHV